ncbi:MAG: ABC transporter substrate-binding protein [Dehalococcoidia bacterium]|nr:ABC transporter substrate-binding protein [Dehalococcoidia bacterium]
MQQKWTPWYKVAALVLVLALAASIIAACGDDEKEEALTPSASAPAATTAAATTPTITVSNEPIKIGLLSSWSGSAGLAGFLVNDAMKIVQKQIDDRGGINVGGVIRPVEWIKYDDKTQVAQSGVGYKKLVLQDHVSAVLYGGASTPCLTAASDAAEELKVPLFSVGATPADLTDRPYTIRCVYPNLNDLGELEARFVASYFKPETVGFLTTDMTELRERVRIMKDVFKAAGDIKTVYEEYAPVGTVDFSSLLTGVRRANPDILMINGGGPESFHIAIFNQMPQLGGWGDITVFSTDGASSGATALKEKGAEGTYHWVSWAPGFPFPAAAAFEQTVRDVLNRSAQATDTFMYIPPWVAITAIEMAGSDKPEDIARAARSGDLAWEGPAGPITIQANGLHSNVGNIVQYKDGKLTLVSSLKDLQADVKR